MFKDNSSWLFHQHSSLESPNFNCMIAPAEPGQYDLLPGYPNSPGVTGNMGANGLGFSCLPKRPQATEANGLYRRVGPQFRTSFLTPYASLEGKQSVFPAGPTSEKKFIIFDRSGNETRLFLSSLYPSPQNLSPIKPSRAYNFSGRGPETKQKQSHLEICEDSAENHFIGEGSDIHEDTEEIDALLYSEEEDDDDGNDNACVEDDEVSTGHSPVVVKRDREMQGEDDSSEVASSYECSEQQHENIGRHSTNPTTMVSPHGFHHDNSSIDLSCALVEKIGPVVGKKRPRKDEIRDTLKILGNVIPGVKSGDPLLIIDEAINYLKRLKSEAEVLSVDDPESSSCYGPTES